MRSAQGAQKRKEGFVEVAVAECAAPSYWVNVVSYFSWVIVQNNLYAAKRKRKLVYVSLF